jgi:hypothetical protein
MEKLKKQFVLLTLVVLAMQSLLMGLTAAAYSAGDVVINEIAWAGTADNYNDEWMELYNSTGAEIDLSGWYIEDDGTTVYTIESGAIAAHGYFLIEDKEEATDVAADAVVGLSFSNAGDSLVLKDASGVTVDTVNASGGAWYAGDSTIKASMERIDPTLTQDTAENWASASNGNGSVGNAGSEILGTPGSANSNYGGGAAVSFAPGSMNVENGGTFSVTVDVSEAIDLYAYGMEIQYNPAVLNFDDASEGNFLKADGASTNFNYALENGNEGTLIVGNARILNPPYGVDGSGSLFELSFNVVGTDADESALTFYGTSFVSDSLGDMPANFQNGNVIVGSSAVEGVANLEISLGTEIYDLELNWTAPSTGADSYIIKREFADGSYLQLAEVTELSYVDSSNLLPNLDYNYQVIAVNGGVSSPPALVLGRETRGVLGDNDQSLRVDGRDLERFARTYGSTFGEEEYHEMMDTNFDGMIDGSDLIDIGANFGVSV